MQRNTVSLPTLNMRNITYGVLSFLVSLAAAKLTVINDTLTNGTVTPEWNSTSDTYLDGPKLSGPANDTSYDWSVKPTSHF